MYVRKLDHTKFDQEFLNKLETYYLKICQGAPLTVGDNPEDFPRMCVFGATTPIHLMQDNEKFMDKEEYFELARLKDAGINIHGRYRHGYFYSLDLIDESKFATDIPALHEVDRFLRLHDYEPAPTDTLSQSGFFYYPPNGYMSWHTNEDMPYARMYIKYSVTGDSYFQYINEDGELVKDMDNKGWTIRLFEAGAEEYSIIWHSIYGGQGGCFSCGYRVKPLPFPSK